MRFFKGFLGVDGGHHILGFRSDLRVQKADLRVQKADVGYFLYPVTYKASRIASRNKK